MYENDDLEDRAREVFGEDYDTAKEIFKSPPTASETAEIERKLAEGQAILEYLVAMRKTQTLAAHEGDAERNLQLSTTMNLVLATAPQETLLPIIFYAIDVLAADSFIKEGRDDLTTMPVSLDDMPPI